MKKLKLLLLLLVVGVISSGCVKFNANMEIKKNKSMDYTIIYALDKSYFQEGNSINVEDFKEAETNGFKVEKYSEGNMEGVKLTRTIKNIDEISTEEDAEYNLSGVTNQDDNKYMFKVKKGLFKNTYTAKFIFDSSESELIDDESDDEFLEDDTFGDEIEYEEDEDTLLDSEDGEGLDFSNMTSTLDLSFNVKLPYKAISNNATKVEDNEKSLTWSLTTSGNDAIEFEFSLYNMNLIWIGIGILLVIIIVIVMIIVMGKKNKKEKAIPTITEEYTKETKKTIDSLE